MLVFTNIWGSEMFESQKFELNNCWGLLRIIQFIGSFNFVLLLQNKQGRLYKRRKNKYKEIILKRYRKIDKKK